MKLFDAINPFDSRYYGADEDFYALASPYLSEEAQIKYQIRVEVALLEAFVEIGLLSAKDAPNLDKLEQEIPPSEVYEEERITQHNVRALVNCIKKRLPGKAGAFIHLTATSCDITDTARALSFKEFASRVLVDKALFLLERVISLARTCAGTAQIGRTHGQHAIPTTFGHAMALYVSRIGKRIEKIAAAAEAMPGKISGAVGTYAAQSIVFPGDPKALERAVLGRLGLAIPVSNIASQIVEPEYTADLCYGAISLLSVLANLADDMRHLMRSEIGEIGKIVDQGHVGSSTMPHKVNPVDFENVKSLWKAYMPRMITVFSDQISEHQRDLTNSASGRFVPELLGAVAYAVMRMRKALDRTTIDGEAMKANLNKAMDQFIAEPLYIVFSANGINNGYEIVRDAAKRARDSKRPLADTLSSDPALKKALSGLPAKAADTIKAIIRNPETYIGIAEKTCLEVCGVWEGRIAAIKESVRAFA